MGRSEGGHPPRLIDARNEDLRKNGLQIRGDLHADLLLLGIGESVDDPIHGARGPGGVEGGKDEVAGLRRGDRGLHGLQVAHFPHEDHVGILAERPAQTIRKARHVHAEFALVHDATLMFVKVLDRILDGDDVVIGGGIDHVEHRGERRRLARTGRAGHLERLQKEMANAGKERQFHYLKPFLCEETAPGGYDSVASTLGMSVGAVRMGVLRLRERFGSLVRDEVAHTLASQAETGEEMRYLIELVSG